jgi:hypothetical protein
LDRRHLQVYMFRGSTAPALPSKYESIKTFSFLIFSNQSSLQRPRTLADVEIN